MTSVLVFGSGGQLGREIVRSAPASAKVGAVSHSDCDITDLHAVGRCMERYAPEIVINAAAYTAVDRAESERDAAFAANAEGPANLAREAKKRGARMVQVSTDYVFDGSLGRPYRVSDPLSPLGVYGASKAAGESAVVESGVDGFVLRTSWLYASHGRNFLSTILGLLRSGSVIRVVNDQFGVPTAARDLAAAIWKCVALPQVRGILHWTNAGSATWYEFAVAIQELALSRSLLWERKSILPITTAEYPSSAPRPAYSVLDSTETWALIGEKPADWQNALALTIDELVNQN